MNLVILNWLWQLQERDCGVEKRTGKGEPLGVVIHTRMETTQGNSLYSYLKLAEMPCFSYFLCFFLYNIGEQEGRIGSAQSRGGLAMVGEGR
jgi:hypothetical protein